MPDDQEERIEKALQDPAVLQRLRKAFSDPASPLFAPAAVRNLEVIRRHCEKVMQAPGVPADVATIAQETRDSMNEAIVFLRRMLPAPPRVSKRISRAKRSRKASPHRRR